MNGDGSFSIGSTVWPGTSKVIEEMGEALQVLGKLLATAGDPTHWDGTDLRERLVEEVGDVLGALRFWTDENLTAEEFARVAARCDMKWALFNEWHEAQA